MSFVRLGLGVAGAIFLLSACDGGGDGTGGTGGTGGGSGGGGSGGGLSGEALYSGPESAALGSSSNEARCSTCHSNDGTQDGYSGNSMKDIAYRATFKGGMADLLGGVNACVTGWMGGDALTADSAEFVAFKAYFESISSESVTDANAIAPDVLADVAAYEAKYSGGNEMAGADVYAKACARCHDDTLTLNVVPAPAKTTLSAYSIGRIAQQVRTAGPPPSGTMDASDSTPGPMPFFEPKDLSDQDVKDVIAHLLAQ
ncbi:MAG: c-type cytochrome [Polyangiaceae bacterium]|nr:c-type cytochrome [Polyangiaceae bacterium]